MEEKNENIYNKNRKAFLKSIKSALICVLILGFWILGLRFQKETKIGCVGWLSALSGVCVKLFFGGKVGSKQQVTQCLRGLCVRKKVVWRGV